MSQYNLLLNADSSSAFFKLLRDWQCPFADFNADEFIRMLSSLDPSRSTLVYSQILVDALNLAATSDEFATLAEPLSELTRQIQFEQIALFPEILRRLAHVIRRMAQLSENSAYACSILVDIVETLNKQMALTRLPPISINDIKQHKQRLGSGSNHGVRLTPLHIECLRQCLLANRRTLHERVAQVVLATRLDAIGKLAGQRLRPFLEYHHYAGMVYTGLQQMEQALHMWRMVFAVPTCYISTIQIHTFKRFTLAHVLVHGTRGSLPAMFVPAHVRPIESQAAAYVALADACATKQIALAVKAYEDMHSVLVKDSNLGLAMRLINELPAHCVRHCSGVYVRLPLNRLAQVINFSEHPLGRNKDQGSVEDALGRYIQNMNDPCVVLEENGGVMAVRYVDARATVSPIPGAAEPPGVPLEVQWSQSIAAKAQEANALQQYLQEIDQHLALTRDYTARTKEAV
ncbi:COP9 signalosome complex subunit 3 [Coemansia sp. RSA 1813]|nr:COP9 signalosome complex subunit 3 [Coemansia sp. RSA 1646]KAJ1769834.1 COP9 signalosome complex subunit 3 [Coemansia sp. RSA 1843]KAJ2087023.1 COP9 signalosome complex subunit 3 [Coemansia sp. RSA 986]KAJ2211864.1 COP9 signalosome complex subunit 3 [Coemansia sp. RSA 487]KAJ2565515.1 COP9 signalosome complex subunit 3 [Coemansia sp. RSA 1813]